MRLNSVVTSLRRSREKGFSFQGEDDMIDHGAAMYFNDALRQATPGTTRNQRKQRRIKPPPSRPGVILYRSDGAARGQGSSSRAAGGAGWGAVCFGSSGQDSLAESVAWGWLGEATNNEAEYQGLLAVLEDVQACGHGRVNIQMDSMLVVMQIR